MDVLPALIGAAAVIGCIGAGAAEAAKRRGQRPGGAITERLPAAPRPRRSKPAAAEWDDEDAPRKRRKRRAEIDFINYSD